MTTTGKFMLDELFLPRLFTWRDASSWRKHTKIVDVMTAGTCAITKNSSTLYILCFCSLAFVRCFVVVVGRVIAGARHKWIYIPKITSVVMNTLIYWWYDIVYITLFYLRIFSLVQLLLLPCLDGWLLCVIVLYHSINTKTDANR